MVQIGLNKGQWVPAFGQQDWGKRGWRGVACCWGQGGCREKRVKGLGGGGRGVGGAWAGGSVSGVR